MCFLCGNGPVQLKSDNLFPQVLVQHLMHLGQSLWQANQLNGASAIKTQASFVRVREGTGQRWPRHCRGCNHAEQPQRTSGGIALNPAVRERFGQVEVLCLFRTSSSHHHKVDEQRAASCRSKLTRCTRECKLVCPPHGFSVPFTVRCGDCAHDCEIMLILNLMYML